LTGLVLGLSVSHCGSACLVREGEVLAAVAEERLSGRRKDRVFGARPSLAVDAVLREVGASLRDVELAVLCPQEERRLPMHDVARNPQLRPLVEQGRVHFLSHHLGHAYAVYGCSGLDEATILIADGRGSPLEDLEAESAAVCLGTGYEAYSIFRAAGGEVVPVWKQLLEPAVPGWDRRGLRPYDSCGTLFESVAHFVFGDTDAAGKVMALAPFGEPAFDIEEIFTFTGDGIWACEALRARIGPSPPACGPERERLNADLSCSAQLAAERVVLEMARRAKELTGGRRLGWSGGVALNCVANERLIREAGFDEVFILPGSDDRGTAIGAAFYGERLLGRTRRPRPPIRRDAWGTLPAGRGVERALGSFGRDGLFARQETSGLPETAAAVAARLAAGQVGGLFSGRSELGPRALGFRSILGDARSLAVKDRMNATVKLRESFRPFGPAVLEERAAEWFDLDEGPRSSPFMLRAVAVRPEVRDRVPGAAHVDGSARLQTVSAEPGTLLRATLEAFAAATGVPMVLNTSFNLRGEPIIEREEDALWMLALTDLDFVAFDGAIVEKKVDRPEVLRWRVSVPAGVRRQLDGGPAGDREIVVRSPFGESVQHLYARLVQSLGEIEDGVSIADLVTAAAESEAQLLGRLGVLRRRGLVRIDPGGPA
jgi:carbamoyltransferase